MKGGTRIALVVLVIVVVIIIVGIIVAVAVTGSEDDTVMGPTLPPSLDNPCDSDADCGDGLVCEANRCKMPVGYVGCVSPINCVEDAICVGSVCVIPIENGNGNGGDGDSSMDSSRTSHRPRPPHPTRRDWIDIVCTSTSKFILLRDGRILHMRDDFDSSHTVENNVDLDTILKLENDLWGVSEGRLYRRDEGASTKYSFVWRLMSWAPREIVNVSAPHDSSVLWLQSQTPDMVGNENTAYLYERTPEGWENVWTSNVTYFRFYGRSDDTYLELDLRSGEMVRYPDQARYEDVKTAALGPSGKVALVRKGQAYDRVRLCRGEEYLFDVWS